MQDRDALLADILETTSSYGYFVSDATAPDPCIYQIAMMVDRVNKNMRVYPKKIVAEAIKKARKAAKSGAMLSEITHPEVVSVCDWRGCGERPVDNGPTNKTAVVKDISNPDKYGFVWIKRQICDTPAGDLLRQKIANKEPLGISLRGYAQADRRVIDGQNVDVANELTIETFDDVLDPAVEDAGRIGDKSCASWNDSLSVVFDSSSPVFDGGEDPNEGDYGTARQITWRNWNGEMPGVAPNPVLGNPHHPNPSGSNYGAEGEPDPDDLTTDSKTNMSNNEALKNQKPPKGPITKADENAEKGAWEGNKGPLHQIAPAGPLGSTPLAVDSEEPEDNEGEAESEAYDDFDQSNTNAKTYYAGPHQSFPIQRATGHNSVRAAFELLHHAKPDDQARIARNIIRHAKKMGWEHGVPPDRLNKGLVKDCSCKSKPVSNIKITQSTGAQSKTMNIRDLLRRIPELVNENAPVPDVRDAVKNASDAIIRYKGTPDFGYFDKALKGAIADAVISGYHGKDIDVYNGQVSEPNKEGEGYAADVIDAESDEDKMATVKRADRELKGAVSKVKKDIRPHLDAKQDDEYSEDAHNDDDDEMEDSVKDAQDAEPDKVTAVRKVVSHDSRFRSMNDSQKDKLVSVVAKSLSKNPSVATIMNALDAQAELIGDQSTETILANRGFGAESAPKSGGLSAMATVKKELFPMEAQMYRILDATDDLYRRPGSEINPDSPKWKRLKEFNRKKMEPFIQDVIRARTVTNNMDAFASMITDTAGNRDDAFLSAFAKQFARNGAGEIVADATTVSNLANNPTVSMALLVQSFQWMVALQFLTLVGPGANDPNGAAWDLKNGIGSVLKVPQEGYQDPPNGFYSGTYDMGLLGTEMGGITPGTVTLRNQDFAAIWRRISTITSREAQQALGNGPLGYPAIARGLFHMTERFRRTKDKAALDAMFQCPMEYHVVQKTAESVNLANNTVYNASGGVTVNLNGAKIANASVASSDPSVVYGNGTGNYLPGQTAGAAVVAAARLLGAKGTGTAAPYYGDGTFASPIVQPRSVPALSDAGFLSFTLLNPFTVTLPTGLNQGYLDGAGNVQAAPPPSDTSSAPTPDYAVDWNNGVIVFTAHSGVTGSAGVMSTATTIGSYSAATNYTNFIATQAFANLGGMTYNDYLNGLLMVFDQTSAKLGSMNDYRQPNLSIMSLNNAALLVNASQFRLLQNVKGTELYPTDNYFAERNGIDMARVNTPWNGGDQFILVTSHGSTIYGVDTPYQIRGPWPVNSTAQNIVSAEVFYGEENSLFATPMMVDQNGNPYQTPSSLIRVW